MYKYKLEIMSWILLLMIAMPFTLASAAENQDRSKELKQLAEAYKKGDYPTAFKIAEPLAQQGNAQAQLVLGTLYQHGRGVQQNNMEALKWIERSAEQGNRIAQYNLGVIYYEGKIVSRDNDEAYKWIKRAADGGYQKAKEWVDASKREREKIDPLKVIAKHGFADHKELYSFTNRLPTDPKDDSQKEKFMDEQLYSRVLGLYRDVKGLREGDFDRSGSQSRDKSFTMDKLIYFQEVAPKYFKSRDYALKLYKQEQEQQVQKLQRGAEVEKKYSDAKGGWRFLKWGMSVDEAEAVSIKNNAKFGTSSEPESENVLFLDTDNRISAKFKMAGVSSDQFGKYSHAALFFYKDRLVAARIGISSGRYIDDRDGIMKALKEAYPGGRTFIKKYPNLNTENFRYESKFVNVYTVFIPNIYADNSNGVYYADPIQTKAIKDAIANEKTRAIKEKETSIRKSF